MKEHLCVECKEPIPVYQKHFCEKCWSEMLEEREVKEK